MGAGQRKCILCPHPHSPPRSYRARAVPQCLFDEGNKGSYEKNSEWLVPVSKWGKVGGDQCLTFGNEQTQATPSSSLQTIGIELNTFSKQLP